MSLCASDGRHISMLTDEELREELKRLDFLYGKGVGTSEDMQLRLNISNALDRRRRDRARAAAEAEWERNKVKP